MLKGLGDMGKLMKQAQEMQAKMAEVQERMKTLEAEGSSGAGLVSARATAEGEVKRLSVDPSLLLQQRVLTGSSFGGGHQRTDVPMLIDLYMSGKYKLDELISRRLPLSELNRAFDLMLQGEVKRSVIVYS